MAIKSHKTPTDRTSDGFAYLTKRVLVQKAKSAGKTAAKSAMESMGYVITVKDGWLVKEHQDGTTEHLEELQPS